MPDDEQTPEDDKFRPEAIAARVDTLGDESETDRIAREEEQKLLVRRKTQKKTGLQAAASKRLNRIGETAVKRPSAVGAVAQNDPLLDGVARANRWIRQHSGQFAGMVGIVVVGLGGVLGYTAWQNRRNTDASALLAQAFADEHGHLAAKDADDEEDVPVTQLYPTFKSAGDRRMAALGKYRAVESKYAGTGAALLARLGEGSILLDESDAKGALAAYGEVKGSALAKADSEVRGRALEGTGFANELLAQSDEAGKDKHFGDAMAAFKELESVDVMGFKELGMFHQARVLAATGEKAKAIELLKDLQKEVSGSGESHGFSYLQFVVEDRLRELDPTALPPKAPRMPPGGNPGAGGGAGSDIDMNDPKVQEIIRQMQQKRGGGAAPAAPGSPQ